MLDARILVMRKKGPYLRKKVRIIKDPTNFVRQWRELREWTQEQLAEKSGLSLSSISAYERYDNDPSVDALRGLGKAIGVPGGMILDVDPSEDASMWKPYLRASVAQKHDMARVFNALIGDKE